MLCSYPSESIIRELIPLHSMQAKVLDQGFPNVVDWWGRGQFGQNDQKLHEKYKIWIFWSKHWGWGWMGGGQVNFLGSGRDPPVFHPLGETDWNFFKPLWDIFWALSFSWSSDLDTNNVLFCTSLLFKQSSILKFQDEICLENILTVSKLVSNLTPPVFNTWFSFSSGQHNYETSSSRQGYLIKSSYRTNRYGKYSKIASAVDSYDKMTNWHYWKIYPPIILKQLSVIFILNHSNNFYSSWSDICNFS